MQNKVYHTENIFSGYLKPRKPIINSKVGVGTWKIKFVKFLKCVNTNSKNFVVIRNAIPKDINYIFL